MNMLDNDKSVNNEKLADSQMDKEEFWQDEEVSENESNTDTDVENDEVEQIDDETEESEKESEVADPTEQEKPVKKQSDDENAKFAAARREAEAKMAQMQRQFEERQNAFAKQYGYSSFEEMESVAQAQKYVEQGYDEEVAQKLAKIDNYEKDLQQKLNSARIAEEKSKLINKPFFKEYEAEVDAILQHNPNVPVEVVFNNVLGANIDKILENRSQAIKQKALNNISSKNHIKSDGKGVEIDSITLDDAEWKFYKALNPKGSKEDYIKFKKSEKRR